MFLVEFKSFVMHQIYDDGCHMAEICFVESFTIKQIFEVNANKLSSESDWDTCADNFARSEY